MIYPVYSYRDDLNGFGGLVLQTSDASMIRQFSMDVNNAPAMAFSPKDYSLYKVGTFDSEKGVLTGLLPELVITGTQVFNEVKKDA